MIEDPIVEEVRRHRKEHAVHYENNLKLIAKALREKEANSKHKHLNPGPKRLLQPTGS